MKKLTMVVAIVCAATFAKGAACQWSIAGVTASESTAVAAGAMIAYFMDGSTYSTFTGLEADQVGAYVADKGLSSATITVGRTGATAGTSFGSFSPGDKVNGYVVIFDDSDATKANYFAYTAAEEKTVPGAGNVQFSKSFATETSGWQSVPEPTSGLLLLVGGALLGLRRRRA